MSDAGLIRPAQKDRSPLLRLAEGPVDHSTLDRAQVWTTLGKALARSDFLIQLFLKNNSC